MPNFLPRLPADLSQASFLSDCVQASQPVIVKDAMRTWRCDRLTINYLVSQFGAKRLQVYDDLFNLTRIMTLAGFAANHLAEQGASNVNYLPGTPYARWYSQFKSARAFPWSDDIFHALRGAWIMPSFLPDADYLLPNYGTGVTISAVSTLFPGRGIFISPAGARTRLHVDPWASDAILCQLEGAKRVRLLEPGLRDTDVGDLDIEGQAKALQSLIRYDDVLCAGEILFIPASWPHHVNSHSTSMSLTWNFVHQVSAARFHAYLAGVPAEDVPVLDFFGVARHGLLQ